jgi:hypothetical protein
LRLTCENTAGVEPREGLMGKSFTKRLRHFAWAAVAGCTIGCASFPKKSSRPNSAELPEQGAAYSSRLNRALRKAPNADTAHLVQQFFDQGYNASMSDYFTLRDGHIAIAKHQACLASLSAMMESDTLRDRAGVARSTLDALARGCSKWSEDVAENVRQGLSSGLGPAYEQDRVRVARRAAEMDPDNSRSLRQAVIGSFEEGYRTGLEDRPGGRQGSLDAAEEGAVVEQECTRIADSLAMEDLRTTLCEAALRNLGRGQSNRPGGR